MESSSDLDLTHLNPLLENYSKMQSEVEPIPYTITKVEKGKKVRKIDRKF